MRLCTKCGIHKEMDAFHNYKKGPQGKAYRCKVCDTEARKAYQARHPARVKGGHRRAMLLHKYNLTIEKYDSMWAEQGGKCCICDTAMTNILIDGDSRNKPNTACVDHCHTEGHVRGLLCSVCNKALGMFYDRVDLLKNAIKYLEDRG